MQGVAIRQIKLEHRQNFTLHPKQLMFSVCMVHQIAQLRDLKSSRKEEISFPLHNEVTLQKLRIYKKKRKARTKDHVDKQHVETI